jgi:HEAT repeat protein
VALLLLLALAGVFGAAWPFLARGKAQPEPVAAVAPPAREAPAQPPAPAPEAPSPPASAPSGAEQPLAPPAKEARAGLLPPIGPRLAPAELLNGPPAPSPAPAAAPAAPPKAPTARRARSEADLLKELAGVPEVGLTPPEVRPLVQAWMAAFKNTYDETNSGLFYEPLPLLLQRPDLVQLPLRQGRATRITGREAAHLESLSERLHGYLDRLTAANCGACHTVDLRLDVQRLAGHASEPPADLAPLRKLLHEEKEGKRQVWRRPEAVAALQQILMPESAPYRKLLVELLDEIGGKRAVTYLAQRAVFDLSPEVRRQAVEALRKRPKEEYRKALLTALRYPWPPAAEHAAAALVAVKDQEAVPYLVSLLKEPDPSGPVKLHNGRFVVPQVVRLRHTFNCLTCHPPAAKPNEPVPGAVPGAHFRRVVFVKRPPSPLERAALAPVTDAVARGRVSSCLLKSVQASLTTPVEVEKAPVFVRGDITFLRQDFSVQLPMAAPDVAQPVGVRFDYVVCRRLVPRQEAERLRELCDGRPTYPQREAVLRALRELTGKDAGYTTEAWRQLYPEAELDTEVARLTEELVSAPDSQKDAVLARLNKGKGVAHSEALAAAIPRLTGRWRERARLALADRLTRMTANTLRDKLRHDDAETRRAAATAALRKKDAALVPDLRNLLEDADPAVAAAARRTLAGLTASKPDTTAAKDGPPD